MFGFNSWEIATAHEMVEIGQSMDEYEQKLIDSENKVKELESKLTEIKAESNTLRQQINYMDTQIQITNLKILQLENDINDLTNQIEELSLKIESLDYSLDQIATLLSVRIVHSYKNSWSNELSMFLGKESFTDAENKIKLLQTVQNNDRQLLISMQKAKNNFEEQKSLKETKQLELDSAQTKLVNQKNTLDQQKKGKQVLLDATKNDEKKYQELLASAKAEQSAIQAAISSLVKNLKNGTPVKAGDPIALMGNSGAEGGCSTGPHLHFEITDKQGNHRNPADYLTSNWSLTWDVSPDPQFELKGDWDWPMKNPRITQAYGMSWWAKTGFYGGKPHTGIDMVDNNDITIRTPKDGTLYKGAASCRGKPMNYVAVDHGEVISWYWHVK